MYIGKQENSPWRTDWFVKASFPIVQGSSSMRQDELFNAPRSFHKHVKTFFNKAFINGATDLEEKDAKQPSQVSRVFKGLNDILYV